MLCYVVIYDGVRGNICEGLQAVFQNVYIKGNNRNKTPFSLYLKNI